MREIPLTRGKVTLVDEEDFDLVSAFRWRASPSVHKGEIIGWYAARSAPRNERPSTIYLHRFLLGVGPDKYVDHRDHDGLNNRRENIRECSHSQNLANQRCNLGGSGYRGVHLDRRYGTYIAQIEVEGRRWRSPTTKDPIAAARSYDREARRAFGEFAILNFPDEVV